MSSRRMLDQEVVACTRCPRLVQYRHRIGIEKRRAYRDCEYWARPVPGFGTTRARLVLVGLAPGAHGANRTGRMFTGDSSGDFLYPALHRFGFATQPDACDRNDGLRLRDCYITNVVRCAPPGNKPAPIERERCAGFLRQELALLRRARVFVALGRIAFEDLWRQIGDEGRRPDFTHGAEHALSDLRSVLLCSYHPSRQNTQTGRLTAPMFDAIFARAQQILAGTSLGTSMPISLPERD